MKNFNASHKIFFTYFSVISDINNREKNIEICQNKFETNKINRAKRERDVNILKAFINDFLNDVVIFLKSSNEIDLILKFKT